MLEEDAFQVRTNESESRQNWSQISKVRKTHNGFLLYPNKTVYFWIPVTAFATEDDCTRAEELLRSKVKDFANVR